MNTKASVRVAILALAALVAILAVAKEAEAVTCNPLLLIACRAAMATSSTPSEQCCRRLKEQLPCLCQYYRDPTLSQYVNSPGARKVAIACSIQVRC